MANKKNKLFIASLIITGIGAVGYIVGLAINNTHINAISTEILGAGLVATIVSLIK